MQDPLNPSHVCTFFFLLKLSTLFFKFNKTKISFFFPQVKRGFSTSKQPVRVAVTGASGQIGYALLFRIARYFLTFLNLLLFLIIFKSIFSGEMLGKDQPVIIQALELTPALNALKGVAMELSDCAFPLLRGVVQTDDPNKAFEGADFALLVGAKPRTKGMERGDLLKANAEIFKVQGKVRIFIKCRSCLYFYIFFLKKGN